MTASVSLAADTGHASFACSVAAHGVVEASLAEIATLREEPWPPVAVAIPPRFLRHADEQTVVGLAAVRQAIDRHRLHGVSFEDWGVLAAPHFLGRIGGAAIMTRFQQGGAATVSPHSIPQLSLHSVSGSISIALGMHGPNFGVGGGAEALAEGLTVALSFLDQRSMPGVWLVLTQWTPEPVPDGRGSSTMRDAICCGVAMALVPGTESGQCLRLTGGQPGVAKASASRSARRQIGLRVSELAACLESAAAPGRPARWWWPMPWGGKLELILKQQRQLEAA